MGNGMKVIHSSLGITPKYTSAYSPEQNGKAERGHEVLISTARAL